MAENHRKLIGGEEWCALPDLGLHWVKSRVDSGARTSALHAWSIRRFERDGVDWVSFRVHPLQRDRRTVVECEAPLVDHRGVKSSSGVTEKRYVIRTTLSLAGLSFPVELTLTSRDSMGYRMLLGREAMADRLIVDPSVSFQCAVPAPEQLDEAYAAHLAEVPHLAIGVLASGEPTPLAEALPPAARERGHTLHIVDPAACTVGFEDHHEQLECEALPANARLDAVISLCPREASGAAGLLLRHFETLGAYGPSPARALLEVTDPVVAYQRLARSGAALPDARWYPSGVPAAPDDAPRYLVRSTVRDEALVVSRGEPVPSSTIGEGVLVQALPDRGELVRCFVAGTRVVATPIAVGEAGEFVRPRRRAPRLPRQSRRDIRRAVRALGVKLARVDVLLDGEDLVILDVDPFAFPSVTGRSAATVARALLKYIERAMGRA